MRPEALYDRPLVVMGVAGSGKSTIASALARHLGREFRDGDSFHSPDNVAKMARGQALTDHDRLPWLDSIAAWLAATPRRIVACSALRESYRDRLRVAGPLLFLYLDITPSTAAPARGRTSRALHARLAHRRSIRHVGKANER